MQVDLSLPYAKKWDFSFSTVLLHMLVGALCAMKADHVVAFPDGLRTSMRRGLVVGLSFSASVRSGVVVGCRSIPS